ncbi:MAG: histidinol dehydrogenase [Methylocystaceae bacterium]
MVKVLRDKTVELEEFLGSTYQDLAQYEERVQEMGVDIKNRGNEAVLDYTRRFDGADLTINSFLVSSRDIAEAYGLIDDDFLPAIQAAISNIRDFHSKQLKPSWMEPDRQGNILGMMRKPLARVGIYVPGGTAAYPSSVMMNAIPAQVAGVSEIVMVSPPDKDGRLNPYTLVTANELGIKEIYKVGGAQAIFCLAWGTETVRRVDKITGPGNIYVTLAKKMVYGDVDIDMLAGPSEILIIADSQANPAYVAADMMSQAEHDVLARSIVITDSEDLIGRIQSELERQMVGLSRKEIINTSLKDYGAFILVDNMEAACAVANRVAPEHLEIVTSNPFNLLGKIDNAGAVFLGEHCPEPVGDYYAGPNHILPTAGTARFYSPVSVDTFMKQTSVLYFSPQGFAAARDHIAHLADVEGLTAHANSIRIRKGEKQ